MRYEDLNSRELWLEHMIDMMSPQYEYRKRDVRNAAAFNLYNKIREEYERREKPRFVMEIENQIREEGYVDLYAFKLIRAVYANLIQNRDSMSINNFLNEEVVDDMYKKKICRDLQGLWMMLNSLSNKYLGDAGFQQKSGISFWNLGDTAKKIQNLESQKNSLQRDIQNLREKKASLETDVAALKERKANVENEVNSIIEKELEIRRSNFELQLNEEYTARKLNWDAKLKTDYEQKLQESMEQMKETAAYKIRRQELEDLMHSSEDLYRQREETKLAVLQEMAEIKRNFKQQKEDMEEKIRMMSEMVKTNLKQMSEDLDSSYLSATNKLVVQERNMKQDKMEKFIDNCHELQHLLYYQTSEKELGLEPKRIERYLNKFMRILREYGYESVMPEIGEPFDPYKHEEADSRDGEREDVDLEDAVVREVITCGFKKVDEGSMDDEDDYYVRKAEVVVGRKTC